MYSRNYGNLSDTPAKITPPPDYRGSAISDSAKIAFMPPQAPPEPPIQIINEEPPCPCEEKCEVTPPPKEECRQGCAECECGKECAVPAQKSEKTRRSILPAFLSNLSTEDLILIGIIIALSLGLADKDLLLVALVMCVVLM